jgi:hypothetical protein
MKSGSDWKWRSVLVVPALLLAGGNPQEASSQVNTEAAAQMAPDQAVAAMEQAEEADLAEAAVKPISTAKPLPPNVNLPGPVAEVLKLADTGVEESVVMAFVTNSPSPFNLGVEEIIYLNDIGVPGSVVNAMMQRDQALKELSAAPAPAPAAAASALPPNQFAPEPGTPTPYAPEPAEPLAPPEMPR